VRPLPHIAPQHAESGQAALESALVLPLYVFLILGILQLSLMHQARLMTKYAAYRAVRAGAIHNADVKLMEREALAVLLPMIGQRAGGGADVIRPVNGASRYLIKSELPEIRANKMSDAGLKYAEVTICGPTTKQATGAKEGELDFDDPTVSTHDWEAGEKTKLRIQLTFNYRLVIPFADAVILAAARNQAVPAVLRMGQPGKDEPPKSDTYWDLTKKGIYVLPIRATYSMRMQSNLYTDNLPGTNECKFPWDKKQ
jgi:hypothetical protein